MANDALQIVHMNWLGHREKDTAISEFDESVF